MKLLIATIAAAASVAILTSSAKAQSFSCMELDAKSATEMRICRSHSLGALDERMDSWYRRALERARYFEQTDMVRSGQRAWLSERDACGAGYFCIRRAYRQRIQQLKNYVEHV